MKLSQFCFALLAVASALSVEALAQDPKPPADLAAAEIEAGRLVGKQSAVKSLAISGDGKLAASGSVDNVICIWDVPNSKWLRTLKAHTQPVEKLAMTPDGKFIVSSANDGMVYVWETSSGELISRTQANFIPSCVAISDDGRFAAFGTGVPAYVALIDIKADKVIQRIDLPEWHIGAISVNHDGSRIAVSQRKPVYARSGDGYNPGESTINLYKTADASVEKSIENIRYCCYLKFINEGKHLQWVSDQEGFGAIDTSTYADVKRGQIHTQVLWQPAMPVDSSFVVMSTLMDVRQIQPGDTIDLARRLPGNPGNQNNGPAAISADGKIALIGGRGPVMTGEEGAAKRFDGSVVVLDLGKSPAVKRFQARQLFVNASGTIYTVCGRSDATFYDAPAQKNLNIGLANAQGGENPPHVPSDGKMYFSYHLGRVKFESLRPTEETVKLVEAIKAKDRKEQQRIRAIIQSQYPEIPVPYGGAGARMAISPDDRWLIVGRKSVIEGQPGRAPGMDLPPITKDTQVIDVTKKARVPDLATGPLPIESIAFSPNSKNVLLGFGTIRDQPDLEKSFQIWDIEGAKQLQKIVLDGRYREPQWSKQDVIAAINERGVFRWDAKTGAALPTLQFNDAIADIAYNPEGTRLLLALDAGVIKYVDADNGQVILTKRIPEVKEITVQFLLDGSAVAIGKRYDESVSVLPLDLPK